jgi:cell division protein FtsQ
MPRSLPNPRLIAVTVAAAVVLIGSLYAFHTLEQFLIRDVRFTLNAPGSEPNGSESLEISGSAHTSARNIEAVFAEDFGRSVYLIPLSDRRAALRTVDWIKDASVARFWPNRIVVGVSERKPVAFITVGPGRPALIDEEGIILPPAQDRFPLPVLMGVSVSDTLPARRERVRRLLSLLKDLGDAAHNVSEVDVSDPDNLKISEPLDGRLVTLMLGDHNFALRHQNFVNYYGEIQKKLPGASVLDLRLEDRITVVK